MAKKATVLGLARLERKLKRLPAAAKDAIRKAMATEADKIVAMMKRLVAVDEGELRDSIGWTWGQVPRGSLVISTLRGAGVGGDLTITIYAGGGEAYYARWVEFGTVKMKALPFFYVTWRAVNRGSNSPKARVRKAVRDAAKKVATGH